MALEQAIRTGCMGWSYDDWVGPFYPPGTGQRDFLRLYSLVFDAVEVDSSFYSMPPQTMIEQWKQRTPENFRFTLKLPKDFTYEGRLLANQFAVKEFERLAMHLEPKLASVLVMLPPSCRYEHMFDQLKNLLDMMSRRIRYAVEFRHMSWFRPEVYELLAERRMCFVWSSNQYVETPPQLTTDFIYLRFIGDRKITKFDRIRRDRTDTMNNWLKRLNTVAEKYKIGQAFVFSNNHFAGFAPATINSFRRLAGLGEREWRAIMSKHDAGRDGGPRQTSLDAIGKNET